MRFDVFIRYAVQRYKEKTTEYSFRVYVTESLKMRGEGKYPARSWDELVNPPADFDADEIVDRIAGEFG